MSNKPEEKLVPVKWSKESDEELKRLIEESKATVNWTEVAKWEAKGRPYEIDEEILLFYKDELTNLGSNGKSTNLYSTSCTCICLTSLLIFKEPGLVTLTEAENRFLEMLLTQVPGREVIYPGKDAIINLPPRNPPPPKVTLVNIVIKLLDPIKFPVQSQNARGMINELSILGFLHGVIGLNVMGRCKTPTPTPTVIPCCQPGNPGFKTSGEIHAFSSLDTIETIENTTPEKCYEESFNKPDCIELLILINVL
ncbi:unnamed protein product [Rhizophagus irregularis]|nr:unnamed protein product [Rhizophagus irregularis]